MTSSSNVEMVLYRYRDRQVDEIRDARPHEAVRSMKLYLDTYPITKFTPCGCWIDLGVGGKKFVNLNAYRKWAHDTREGAMKSFMARKTRQVAILRNQLVAAEAALCLKDTEALRLHQGMYQFAENSANDL